MQQTLVCGIFQALSDRADVTWALALSVPYFAI